MGSLDGWYHIVDNYRQRKGQIKIEVGFVWS
jgi:hypothetical protein